MKAIKLDEQYRIEPDIYSWKLIFEETRTKDKLDDQRKKTGEKEDYQYEDTWYYPTLQNCLEKFQEEAVKPLSSIKEILSKITEISDTVKELKKLYVSNGKLLQL